MSNKSLIDKDGEVRELSAEDFARFKPLVKANPGLLSKIKRGVGERGPQSAPKKIPISIRMSPEVVAYFRASGKGWQGRVDEVLKEYVTLHK